MIICGGRLKLFAKDPVEVKNLSIEYVRCGAVSYCTMVAPAPATCSSSALHYN
jgi:hypothetical protein